MSVFELKDKMSIESKIAKILGTEKFVLVYEKNTEEQGISIETLPGSISMSDLVWYEKNLERFTNSSLDYIQYHATEEEIEYLVNELDGQEDGAEVSTFPKGEDDE
jgi:hypothetical protein